MFHLSMNDDHLKEWRLVIRTADKFEGCSNLSSNEQGITSLKTVYVDLKAQSFFWFLFSKRVCNK